MTPPLPSFSRTCQENWLFKEGKFSLQKDCSSPDEMENSFNHGMGLLPNEERKNEYVVWLKKRYPQYDSEIQRRRACYVEKKELRPCLTQPLPPYSSQKEIKSLYGIDIFSPPSFLDDIERPSAGRPPITAFMILRMMREDLSQFAGLLSRQAHGIEELSQFFYERTHPSWPERVREGLKLRPAWAEKISRYGTVPNPMTLSAPICSNAAEWRRVEVPIEGLAFRIPLHIPKGGVIPTWYYMEDLRAGFELLKAHFAPSEIEKVLHPGGPIPDMGFYFSGLFEREEAKARESFRGCGMGTDDRGGEYSPSRNHITVTFVGTSSAVAYATELNPQNALEDISPSIVADYFYEAFVHEFGHAVYYRLLDDETRSRIGRFYQWSKEQYDKDPKKNYSYIPNSQKLDPRDPAGHRVYGKTNEWEFFAEWLVEYFRSELFSDPGEGVVAARNEIMGQVFAGAAMNTEAFSVGNLEKTLAGKGVKASLSGSNGFVIPLSVGFGSLSLYPKDAAISGPSLSVGLRPGYQWASIPSGFLGGVGGLLEYSRGLQGDIGKYNAFDLGIWGKIGADAGGFGIYLQPEVGLRIHGLQDYSASPWLGGQVGFEGLAGGVSFYFQAKTQPGAWHSLGGGMMLDIPSMVRFALRNKP